jgi:hypothetical protein
MNPPEPKASPASPDAGFTRRELLVGGGVLAVAVAAGCHGSVTSDPDAAPGAPVWTTIPDQVWVVGVPVYLDLATYCTDPDGDPVTFSLSAALPAGVTLSGSIISGTPTAELATASFTAAADDGRA